MNESNLSNFKSDKLEENINFVDELTKAFSGNDDTKIINLINKMNNINALISDPNESVLIKACRAYKTEIVKHIVELGADLNQTDIRGFSALIYSVCNGSTEIVQILIEAGADLNFGDGCKWTALHYACTKNNKEIAEILINNGADHSLLNGSKKTAFELSTDISIKELEKCINTQYILK